MTPRKKLAHRLRKQGYKLREIGAVLGVSEARVSVMLKPDRHREYNRNYRKTEKAKRTNAEAKRIWYIQNKEEYELYYRFGIKVKEARKILYGWE